MIEKKPYRWKFAYDLGYDKRNRHSFHSIDDYGTTEEAILAGGKFREAIRGISLREKEGELTLVHPGSRKTVSGVALVRSAGTGNPSALKSVISNLLESAKEIKNLSPNTNPEAFRTR